jgi:large subunit ribosomal protein L28
VGTAVGPIRPGTRSEVLDATSGSLDVVMASVCDICGKKPWFGKSVTFSHKRNNRRWNPNVQRVRALVDGTPKRINACTSCIKAGKVVRPPQRQAG